MNAPLRRILVATDFSEQAERAVERAARVATEHGAALEIVHAIPLPTPMPVWGDMAGGTWIGDGELVAQASRRMEAKREALNAAHRLPITLTCESGAVARVVGRRAEDGQADLLVIGATGEGAFAQRLFGSNAQSIVRAAHQPVLVVRLPATSRYAHLLAASDLTEDSRRAARFARRLAPEARLSMFSALEQPRVRAGWFEGLDEATRAANLDKARHEVRRQLAALAAELGAPDALLHVRDGRASHELPGVLADSDADLLSVGAHGKSRIERGLLGSTSQHAISEARCDVLVMPPA